MEIFSLHPLIETAGNLYILGDLTCFDDQKGYDKAFIVKITAVTPKKISRKGMFYIPAAGDIGPFSILYTEDTGKVHRYENIPVTEDKTGTPVFHLTKFLDENHIPYTIPEHGRITWERRWSMKTNTPSLTPYGIKRYIPSRSLALDGTGDRCDFCFNPDRMTFCGTEISCISVGSYHLAPLEAAAEEFFLTHTGDISKEQFTAILTTLMDGNEFGIQTDHCSIHIFRHYRREIAVTVSGLARTLDLPAPDDRNHLPADEETMPGIGEVKSSYVTLICDLLASETPESAEKVLNDYAGTMGL